VLVNQFAVKLFKNENKRNVIYSQTTIMSKLMAIHPAICI
jgi:hypothetical protein